MAAYVVLGGLVWATIQDQRIRLATLAILALFAVKSWLRRNDVMHPEKSSDAEGSEEEKVSLRADG